MVEESSRWGPRVSAARHLWGGGAREVDEFGALAKLSSGRKAAPLAGRRPRTRFSEEGG